MDDDLFFGDDCLLQDLVEHMEQEDQVWSPSALFSLCFRGSLILLTFHWLAQATRIFGFTGCVLHPDISQRLSSLHSANITHAPTR